MPALFDLVCVECGAEESDVPCSMFAIPPCPCGGDRRLTSHTRYHVFVPYFDVGLGVEVTSLAERWRHMRRHVDGDGTVVRERLEYRDHPSPGELAARRDRVEQIRQERAKGHRA